MGRFVWIPAFAGMTVEWRSYGVFRPTLTLDRRSSTRLGHARSSMMRSGVRVTW